MEEVPEEMKRVHIVVVFGLQSFPFECGTHGQERERCLVQFHRRRRGWIICLIKFSYLEKHHMYYRRLHDTYIHTHGKNA